MCIRDRLLVGNNHPTHDIPVTTRIFSQTMKVEINFELPMVMQSPGGIKGLHYTITSTVAGIKGATDSEFKKITDNINKTLLVDKYIYDHWYTSSDLIFLDNTISLHRRQGDLSTGRLGYRIQHNLRYIQRVDSLYLKEPWKSQYIKEINEMNNILGFNDARFPAFNSY